MKPQENQTISDRLAWITWIAFVLALSLVAIRATMLETERNAFFSSDLVGGPGAATSLILDLLCWVPLLLVLLRRAIDPTYVLRLHWSHAILGAMAIWIAASVAWSGDQFLAMVGASKWISGLAILFAMSQLVRSWQRFRATAALCVGLLAIYVAQIVIYKTVEYPQAVKDWQDHKAELITRGNMSPAIAEMFERKVMAGEMMGFFTSSNSYAAILAICSFVTAGFALQRWRDKDELGFLITLGIAVLLGLAAIISCDSRTALAGTVLCALLLTAIFRFGKKIADHSKSAYFTGVGVVLLGWLTVIGVGMTTGGLLQKSLTFRWWYWKGALALVREHPLIGVGFKNFGYPYLAHRIPTAMEEIKDPHNIIVRFFAELGAIGGCLLVVWLARVSWELTRPVAPAPKISKRAESIMPLMGGVFGLVMVGMLTSQTNFMTTDVITMMKLMVYDLLLAGGVALAVARSSTQMFLDDRPAPMLLTAALMGLGGFLLHSFVDFAWAETGIALVVGLLVGAALGIRHVGVAGKKARTAPAIVAAAVLFIGWLGYAVVAWRLHDAEQHAQQADELSHAGNHAEAASQLELATLACPVTNPEYLSRRAHELIQVPGRLNEALALTSQAIALNPSDSSGYLDRAHLARQLDKPDDAFIDYEKSISRNPVDWRVRLELAQYYDQLGRPADAQRQIQEALRYNALLPADEIRAIPADLVKQLKARVGQP